MTSGDVFAIIGGNHRAASQRLTRRLRPTLVLWMVAVLWISAPAAHAQVSASMTGLVSDTSGAAIAGAEIRVKNVETGAVRATVTDGAGRYLFLVLEVGEYEVRSRKAGFQEAVRAGIHLVIQQQADVDLQLRVGAVNAEVLVKGDAPLVNTATTDISGMVGEQAVKELPLNGRSFDLLLTLNPGVVNFTSQKTGGTGVSNSTTASNFAISGNRPQQNIFLLNGVEYTGAAENNMQPGGTSGMLLGVDAVREFSGIPTERNSASVLAGRWLS